MANMFKKVFAMMMVMCMLISMLPVQALAEQEVDFSGEFNLGSIEAEMTIEGDNVVVTFGPVEEAPASEEEPDEGADDMDLTVVEQPEGDLDWESELTFGDNINPEVTDVTVMEGTNSEGADVLVESTTVETSGTLENGDTIVGKETYTETTTTTDTSVRVEGVVEGKETITGEQDVLESNGAITVDVPLTDTDNPETEEVENVNTVEGTTESDERPEIDADSEYNYTYDTVLQQGSVTIETTEIKVEETIGAEGTELDYVRSDVLATEDNDLFYVTSSVYSPGSGEIIKEMAGKTELTEEELKEVTFENGCDYVFIGSGNSSQFYASYLYTTPGYEGEEPNYIAPDNTKYYTHQGKVSNKWYNVEGVYQNGEMVDPDAVVSGKWTDIAQGVLVDREGKLITVYCVDVETKTVDGEGYNMANIEDADYYTDAQAAMIRTIASNGYWGVQGDASTKGSLAAVKEMMANAKDADGNAVFTQDEIDLLSDGAAMTATQYAIWTFSNAMEGVEFINVQYIAKDKETFIGDIKYGYNALKNVPDDEKETVDLIYKLYSHLINMDPDVIVNPNTSDTIINDQNFVEDLSVTVVEKVENHENNADDIDDNDVYLTNVTFKLVVVPAEENGDQLLVKVLDANNNVLASGRIAGELQEGETWLEDDGNGNYTFSGIEMTEGEQNFNLTLEGVQNLKEGVYLYSSDVRDSSQTLIGTAEGSRAVSVSMNIKFELNVEDEVVATERVWRKEHDPITEEPEDPEPPVRYRVARGVGQLETIIDEEVPLAEVPQTGDNSIVWFALILMSVCGLCVLNLSDKKCKA